MVAYNYKKQDKNVLCLKPSIDNRSGADMISSRTGFSRKADFMIDKADNILIILQDIIKQNIACILVDECQFLTKEHINQLRQITKYITVICYGLRTDYMTNLFDGSKRLMEIADSIEEVKTICTYCTKKAIINMKKSGDIVVKKGCDKPDIGGDEKYCASCWNCWDKQ